MNTASALKSNPAHEKLRNKLKENDTFYKKVLDYGAIILVRKSLYRGDTRVNYVASFLLCDFVPIL